VSIAANSRYASSTVVTVNDNGQLRQVIVPSEAVAYTFTYVSHMWTDTDRLDRLANQYTGDPTQWWMIADANPSVMNFATLTPGTVIRVPFSV
jgi:hypothetical protein